jgi:hypothetical protein
MTFMNCTPSCLQRGRTDDVDENFLWMTADSGLRVSIDVEGASARPHVSMTVEHWHRPLTADEATMIGNAFIEAAQTIRRLQNARTRHRV